MTVQVGARGARANRIRAIAHTKDRNRKIALGLLLTVFVVVLAVELPSTLNKVSGSSGSAPPPAQPATASQAATPQPANLVPSLKRLDRLAVKDPFVAQQGGPAAGSTTNAAGTSSLTVAGPAVRAKNFVAKDPFVTQLSLPAATPTSTPPPAPTSSSPSTTAPAASTPAVSGSGFVVILSSAPAAQGHRVASLGVVAAENAGLVDVKSSALPTTGSALDVYMGPFPSQAVAQEQLIRALRDGYTQATVASLPHSPSNQ